MYLSKKFIRTTLMDAIHVALSEKGIDVLSYETKKYIIIAADTISEHIQIDLSNLADEEVLHQDDEHPGNLNE